MKPYNPYRFGFNGKEKLDEITGNKGTDYNFGARVYDARVGRFFSVDPLYKTYSAWSSYCGFNDNPIIYNDPSGKGGEVTVLYDNKTNTAIIQVSSVVYVYNDGSVSDEQMKTALGIEPGSNSSKLSLNREDKGIYLNSSGEQATINFKVVYVVEIIVVSEAEAYDIQSMDEDNPKNNFFKFKNEALNDEQFGENMVNSKAILDNSGNGLNIGVFTLQGFNNLANKTGGILEEIWHTMAGNSYNQNELDKTHNLNEQGNSCCDNATSGNNAPNFTDISAIFKAKGFDINIIKLNNTKKFNVGKDANRLVTDEESR